MGKGKGFSEYFVAIDRRRLGAIAILLLDAVILAAFVLPHPSERPTASYKTTPSAIFDSFNAPFEPIEQGRALVSQPLTSQSFYPYSVIPGGASDAYQLRNAVAQDPTVRAHYANFVVASARVERLQKTQAFYVSYRIGNDIFWTKNAVTIRAGETVLSDGANIARTRCGNRLSTVPVAPNAKNEPASAAMEIADGGVELASIETPAPAEMPVTPLPATTIATPPAVPGVSPVGVFAPPLPSFPIGSGTPLPPGSPSTPTPPSGPTPTPPSGPTPPSTPPPSGPTPPAIPPATPPVPAPESSALLMLATGIGFALLLKRSR